MNNKVFIITISVLLFIIGLLFVIRNKQNTTIIPDQKITAENGSENVVYNCIGEPTPSQAQGPYYKPGSPKRYNIAEDVEGEKLIMTGYVFDSECNPIKDAWIDFWQAGSDGRYDNIGYKLRGHQFTDENGVYRLETVMPAAYETRPPHIHMKVRADNGPVLTSQLYFPNQSQNTTDSIFNPALIVKITEGNGSMIGNFNFIIPNSKSP